MRRRDLTPGPDKAATDIGRAIVAARRDGATVPHGIKDMGTEGDATWTDPGTGETHSVRELPAAVAGAVARITVSDRAPTADDIAPDGAMWQTRDGDTLTGQWVCVDGTWQSVAVGSSFIADGAVVAANISASEELWAKIAAFGAVTTGMLAAGQVKITGDLVDADSVGETLISSDALVVSSDTDRTGMTADGVTHWVRNADGGWSVASRMGGGDGSDQISTGEAIMAGDAIYAPRGNFDELRVGGRLITEMIPTNYGQLVAIGGAGGVAIDVGGNPGSVVGMYDMLVPYIADSWYEINTLFSTYPMGAAVETGVAWYAGTPSGGVTPSSYHVSGGNLGVVSASTWDYRNVTQYFHSNRVAQFVENGYFRLLQAHINRSGQSVGMLRVNDATTAIKRHPGSAFSSTQNHSFVGGPAPAVTQPVPFDSGWMACSAAGTIGMNPGDGSVIQGYDSWGGAGMRWGLWTWGDRIATFLAGAKPETVQIRLTNTHWGQAPGVADICWHGYATAGGTSADYQFSVDSWPTGATFENYVADSQMPVGSLFQAITNGTYKGFAVRTGSTAWNHYGRFSPTAYIRVTGKR